MKSDWKKSKAHLLLLSKFIHANRFEDFARHDYWKDMWNNVLEEPITQAIKRFMDEGMLVIVTNLNELLSYKCKVNELKGMLKQRSLPVSGRKEELIERLVRVDQNGMRKIVAGLSLLECSQYGNEIAELYLLDEKEKRENIESKVKGFLENRKFSDASLAVAMWEKEQVFPSEFAVGIGTELQRNNHSQDVKVSQDELKRMSTIFESKPPKIIASLGNEKLEAVRIAAAMMILGLENNANKWLPANFETDLPFDNETVVRMMYLHAVHQDTLRRYRNGGIKYVEILPAPDSCESCKKLGGKQYKLNVAPELPNEDCTHKMGCRCCYLPVV